jgi:class 3 adenylate cyclase
VRGTVRVGREGSLEVKPSTPAEPSSEELRRLSHANTLRFPDPLEASFRDDYFDRFLLTNRIAWIAGLVLLAAFGLVDVWASTTSRGTILLLRFGVGAPLVVFVIALSFSRSYRRLMQPVGALVAALIGGMVVVMALVYTPTEPGYNLYVMGTILVLVFGYSAPRLRFWYATAAGWTIVAATLLVGFDHNAFDAEHTTIAFGIVEAFIVAANALGMLAAYYIEVETRRSYVQRLRVHQEQDRSDALLLNILPAPVAQKLKQGGTVVQAFDDVTVLFADIVGFTPFSAKLSPSELVSFLNEIFSSFDRLAQERGLEKIKTMGDSYMVVGGVPTPKADHAQCAAEMALRMREDFCDLVAGKRLSLDLRIGLNSGPVVAGVIGSRKFSYDVWGDTVNMASRMESHGVSGRVQVTEATRDHLIGGYEFEGPQTIEVKGAGEVVTYFLVGRRDGSASKAESGSRPVSAQQPGS